MSDLISRQTILDRTVNRNSIWNTITDSEGKNLEDIINSIPSTENNGEWVPVTEETELPEHDVICCDNDGNVALGYLYFDEEEKQIACDRDPYVMFGVVAYMELPEPYKKGK